MAIAKMGKLVEVDIRKLWEHEQYDFSKWLSDKENLESVLFRLFLLRFLLRLLILSPKEICSKQTYHPCEDAFKKDTIRSH